MKKTLTNLCSFILLITLMSCQQTDKPNSETHTSQKTENPNELPDLPDNLTELSIAREDILRYQRLCTNQCGNTTLKGFNLNTRDILSALGHTFSTGESHPYHVRGYFGLDSSHHYKLYIVPVTGDSSQHISLTHPGRDTVIVGNYKHFAPDRTQFVYELNFPCPTLCSSNNIFQ